MIAPDDLVTVVERAKTGDEGAISTLYERFVTRIYRYIRYRVPDDEAEDLTADVFVAMVKQIKHYQATTVPFEAWLFQIASNLIASFYRQHYRTSHVELTEQLAETEDSAEETLLDEQELERVRELIQTLPDEQQQVLVLRFVERMSHEEVAQILNKKASTVKSIQHRALKHLSELLKTKKMRHYLRGHHD